jgi:hypothetical protein
MAETPCRAQARRLLLTLSTFGLLIGAGLPTHAEDAAQPAGIAKVAERAFHAAGAPGKLVSTFALGGATVRQEQVGGGQVPLGLEMSAQKLAALKASLQATRQAGATARADTGASMAVPTAPGFVSSFAGIAYTGWIPPDPIMAAGPSDLLVSVNSSFSIYSKFGSSLFTTTLINWFTNVLPGPTAGISVFDPWVIYDQLSDRFVLHALARRASDNLSLFLIAVSDDSSAIGNWCNFSLNARLNGNADTGFWADYTKVGNTTNAVVLSSNMFLGNSFQYAKLRFLSKSTLYAGNCPGQSWWDFWDLRNADDTTAFTIQPSHSYILSPTSYGLNSYSGGSDRLTLWSYTTPATIPPAPSLTRQATLSTGAYSVPPGAQQGGTTILVETGDARLLNAVYRGSGLWATHTVSCTWAGDPRSRSCLRYYQILPSTNTVEQQLSYGAPNLEYYWPGIVANASGDAVLVFNRSGPSEFVGIRYTGRRFSDSLNTLQGSASLRAGQGCYARFDTNGRNRWGDYNGIAIDPVSSNRAWLFSEYASGTSLTCGDNVWDTYVGQVTW